MIQEQRTVHAVAEITAFVHNWRKPTDAQIEVLDRADIVHPLMSP